MKIQTFNIKVKITGGGKIHELDQASKTLSDNGDSNQFDEGRIALKAQEIAEFNRNEIAIVKSMGDGDYNIDFKLII